MEQWFAYTTGLEEAGALLGGESLQSVDTATCVQVRDD